MLLYQFLVVLILIPVSASIYIHYILYNTVNIWQVLMSFFCALNTIISLWEIGLGLHITFIEREAKRLKEKYRGNRGAALLGFFVHPLNISDAFTLKPWMIVWSTYSIYDPSYSNRESFGFFVDVGNGWSTILPTLAFWMSMSIDIFPLKFVLLISILTFYQEFYGTVIYIASFVFNRRFTGLNFSEVYLFIGFANGLWIVFPLIGIYLCVAVLERNSFSIFRI